MGMAGQQVDVLWFENMGVFSEPIFNFSFVRLTLKQIGTLFGGLLFAYGLATVADQLAGAAVACLALIITFYRPKVMPLEQYVVAAMRFLAAENQRVAEKRGSLHSWVKTWSRRLYLKAKAILRKTPADKVAYFLRKKAKGLPRSTFRKKKST